MKTKKRYQPCPKCGDSTLPRNEKHDAYFCPDCDIWTEIGCDDPDCQFCHNRPAKPSQVCSVGRAVFNRLVAKEKKE